MVRNTWVSTRLARIEKAAKNVGADLRAALLLGTRDQLPRIAEHAPWAEAHARLHEEALAAIVAAGVPRLYLPATLGGYEVDPVTCAMVCESLAAVDSAAAWHVMVFNAARLMAAGWPESTVEALWQDTPDLLVAASGHTPLHAEPDGNGFVVSGRNSFVSGCHHAHYLMSPALVGDAQHTAIVPMSGCHIVDNWDPLGMRGSGSNDVIVERVHVAAHFVLPQSAPDASRNRHYQGTLYRCPSRVVFATYIPVALGLARQGLDALAMLAGAKVPYASDLKLRHRSIAQIHYGRALAKYRSVRGYFYDALQSAWEQALEGVEFSSEQRADLYLAGTHTMQTCGEVVRHVADAAGSSATARGRPLERVLRDMETLRHHGFANESRYGSVAQVHWQAPLDYPLLLR